MLRSTKVSTPHNLRQALAIFLHVTPGVMHFTDIRHQPLSILGALLTTVRDAMLLVWLVSHVLPGSSIRNTPSKIFKFDYHLRRISQAYLSPLWPRCWHHDVNGLNWSHLAYQLDVDVLSFEILHLELSFPHFLGSSRIVGIFESSPFLHYDHFGSCKT